MDTARAAELVARMFGEGHGLACRLDGGVVELPDVGLRFAAFRLGFQPVDAFEQFGAEQTLSTARLHTFKI
jgi:hypothetical protein